MPLSRALGLIIIRRLAPTGLGTNAIVRAVRRAGYGYSNELMGKDIRRYTGRAKNEYWVRKISPSGVIPRDLMVDEELKRSVKYQMFGKATYYNEATELYETEFRSFYTDNLASKEDWERDAIEYSEREETDPERKMVAFDIRSVEHYKGYGY